MSDVVISKPIDPKRLHAVAANMMVHQNKKALEIKQALMNEGIHEEIAQIVIDNVEFQLEDARFLRAKKHVVYGALWLMVGLIIAAVTYSRASSGGISYIVTWGAILIGGIQFVKGLLTSTK